MWPPSLINFAVVRNDSQESIYSKIMLLKFWMIFAKSLSLVNEEISHTIIFFLLHPKRAEMKNSFFAISHLDAEKNCLHDRPRFLIIYFLHQTVHDQSSRKKFSLSSVFFLHWCNFCTLRHLQFLNFLIYTNPPSTVQIRVRIT